MADHASDDPHTLPRLKRRLLLAAAAWLLFCLGVAATLTWSRVQENRQDTFRLGEQRLQSFRDSVDAHFRTLTALSQALAQQPDLADFLLSQPVPIHDMAPSMRQASLRAQLLASPSVRAMSDRLKELVRDFKISQAYLQNVQGTAVADSALAEPITVLGANFRSRDYFIQAMERGTGFQFVMGSVSHKPGFNFSARISRDGRALGILIIKTDPPAMRHLLADDANRVLAVVDRHGVIVASNREQDTIRLMPDAADLVQKGVDVQGVYTGNPARLDWSASETDVGGRTVFTWLIGGRPHLTQSADLVDHPYRLWIMSPISGEPRIKGLGAAYALTATVLGWLMLAIYWSRARRQAAQNRAHIETLAMTRSLPLGLFRYRVEANGQSHFVHTNEQARRLFSALSQDWERSPQQIWQRCGQRHGQPPTTAQEVSVRVDEQVRWLSLNSAVEHTSDGGLTYDGYWLDVSERHRAEARFDLAYQNTPMASFFLHAERGIIDCNPAALKLFQAQSIDELIGLRPWAPPLSPADDALPEQARQHLQTSRSAPGANRFEWPHLRLDGSPFEACVTLLPLPGEDPDQFFAIVEDISHHKATQAALNAATLNAQSTAQAKSAFLANMSHEIRTPMNAIIGMTHLALVENPPERVRHYVSKAHHAATSLLQIINDVLDLSKIEAGHLELELIEFGVQDMLDEVADVLALAAQKKGIELLFTAPPDLPSHLIGDPTRLRQVLLNLGSNAVKFTDTGSVTLGLRTEPLQGQALRLHGWVQDSGIGMSREQIDRLFQPFAQGDASTTRRHGGTGLGLTISQLIIERMGGRIWVESQVGEGSTFHFSVQVQASSSPTPMAPTRQDWAQRRALLVDDQPDALEVLSNMVRAMGVHVEVASSGEEALRRLDTSARPFDWLLVDWKMPGMDGLTLARRIQERPRKERPCILLVTAFDRQAALDAAGDLPLAHVLTKPVTPSTLFDSLSQALNTHTAAHTATQPAQPPAPPPPHATSSAPTSLDTSGLAGRHVLLVEDHPLNQELATDLLERAGLRVTLARDGLDALDTLARLEANGQRPDGVLMDCQMPRMDGYTATQHIRQDPRWAQLPIIAMTASALASDRDQAMACGMNDHIPKPLDIGHMFKTLRRWLLEPTP